MAKRSFNSNGNLKQEAEKAKINKETMTEAFALFAYLKPFRTKFFLGLVFIALSAFSTMIFPFLLGKMIDAAAPGSTLNMPASPIASEGFGLNLKNIHWSLNTILI